MHLNFEIKQERSVIFFLTFFWVITDFASGFLTINYGVNIVSLIYKLILLQSGFLCLIYINFMRTNQLIFIFLIVGAINSYLIINSSDLMKGILFELNVIFDGLYLVILLIFFSRLNINRERLCYSLCACMAFKATIVILSVMFDWGIATYQTADGKKFGFGTMSFFIGGNALGLLFVLSALLCIHGSIKSQNRLHYLCFFFLIIVGGVCVGSRTGVILSSFMLIMGLFTFSFVKGLRIITLLIVILCASMSFRLYIFVEQTLLASSRFREKIFNLLIGSVRGDLSTDGWTFTYLNLDAVSVFFGSGFAHFKNDFYHFGPKVASESQFVWIENDFLDIFNGMGLTGLIIFVMPHVYIFAILLRNLVQKTDITSFIYVLIIFLSIAHAATAGHVFLTPTVTHFVFLVYLISKRPNHDHTASKANHKTMFGVRA